MAKDKSLEVIADVMDKGGNPLLSALRENDKKHLFQSNVTTHFHKTGFHLYDYYFGSVVNIHDENGKLIKQEPRVGQAAGTFNLFIGNSGSGKAEPVSTLIPTPRGPVRMGDITPGMQVFNKRGKPVTVTAVFPHENKEIAKVTFSDGRTTLCDFDHLWEVHRIIGPFEKISVKSTGDILCDFSNKKKKPKYWIPKLTAPVWYNSAKVDVAPYVMGVLIGKYESITPYAKFTIKNSGFTSDGLDSVIIINEMAKYTGFNFNVVNTGGDRVCSLFTTDRRHKYVDIVADSEVNDDNYESEYLISRTMYEQIVMEKRGIPESYIYNNDEARCDFLRGYCDIKSKVAMYDDYRHMLLVEENNETIRRQVVEIARSLGYDVYLHSVQSMICIVAKCTKLMDIVSYGTTNYIDLDNGIPADDHYSYADDRLYIEDITYDHNEDAQCIMVDDPHHLYLTKDYIVTHNTTLAAQIAGNIIRQYKYANVIHFDCENRFDTSRCETITKLPSTFFNSDTGERYMIRTGKVGLDVIQEMIVKTYVNKMKLKDQLYVNTGFKDEFNKDIWIYEPTVIIIDSITTVLNETFNPDSAKEASDAEKMRGNTEGARDAKSLKGFFKDILPLCKEANIIVFGINHINQNMSMNAFIPVAKQQNYLKQDESIPGGKTMIYYPFNIVKLTAKPSDDFTEESDGFAGHIVMIEPIKSSSNQSGNNSKGVSFEMVFSHKYGFDSLRTILNYGRSYGMIEGNKTRMKFKDDPSFTFSLKTLNTDRKEKPIWECVNKFIVPQLKEHLSFIDPTEIEFDSREFDY